MENNILLIIVLKCLLSNDAIAEYNPEWVTAPMKEHNDVRYEYTFFDRELSWNDARVVCSDRNSHMLSIKSQRTANLIQDFIAFSWIRLQSKDYWSGLTEPKEGEYVWDDCDKVEVEEFHNFKGESYNKEELCYMVKHSAPYHWESKKCTDKKYFACEKAIPGECAQKNILSSNQLATYQNKTLDECKNSCAGNERCWAGVVTYSGMCILLEFRDGSEPFLSEVTMFKKFCEEVKMVDESAIPDSDEHKNLVPYINCTGFTLPEAPSILPFVTETTPVSEITPSPCFWYETYNITHIVNETEYVTVNMTSTQNVTQTVNWTDTIQVIQTLYFTHSLSVAETFTHTLTSSVTESISTHVLHVSTHVVTSVYNTTDIYNVTQTINVTETVNSTSIIYHSSCTESCVSGNKSYSSPDDPLFLEAVSSMKKELTVDKKKTNAHKRKLTSAPDTRRSSQVIGMTGVLFICTILAVVLLADIPTVLKDCGCCFRRCRST